MMLMRFETKEEAFENFKKVQKQFEDSRVKELKHKKDVPTVIEYQGRRYVLDDRNRK